DLLKQAREKERVEREYREVERAERMKKLDEQARRLDDEVMRRLDHVRALQREAAANVDAKVLEAALAKSDEKILSLEEQIATPRENREGLRKELAAVPTARPKPRELEEYAQHVPEVRAASKEYVDYQRLLEERKRLMSAEKLLAFEKEVKDKADQL